MADRWPALFAATVAFMAAQGFGRFGFALILPSMRDGLGLSNGEMGLMAGIGLAAYLLSSAPIGALAAWFGTRRVVVGGLLGIAAGLAGTGLAEGFATAAVAQVLVGAASPGVIVPVLAAGSAWFPPSVHGRVTGLVVAGGGLGVLATGLVLPLLLEPGEESAWRRAWAGLALGTLAASLLVALLLRDPPAVGSATARPRLGAVYRSAAVWRLGIVFGLYAVAYIVYGTFFAAHLAQRGVDGATAGRLWSLVGVASIGSGLLGGVLADRLGSSSALAAMFAMEGAALALLALGDGLAWYAVSAVLFGASFWGFPPAIAKACAALVGPALAPAAIGLLAVFFGVGQVFGPVVGGLLADRTGALSAALLLGVAADAAGGFGSLLLPQRGRR